MTFWKILVIFVICFSVSHAVCNVSDCSLLKELECALYTTDSNEKRLNQAFFPPRKATSRYIKVDYIFNTTEVDEIEGDSCNVTYIWSIGGFLLIQPPSIFQLTSLMFSYPTNNIDNITIFFPAPCHRVITTTGGKCSCARMEKESLDILTQQLLQYSKYSNPEGIVRDVTSVAQALCVEDIELGYFDHVNVTVYIVAKLVLPVLATTVSLTLLYNYYPKLTVKVTDPNDRPTIVGILMAGVYIFLYIIAVDIAAIVFYVANKTEYQFYPPIARSRSLQLVYYSFICECALSSLALLVAAALHKNKRKPMRLCKSSRFIIILFILFVFIFSVSLAMVIHYPNNNSIIMYTALWFAVLIVTIAFMLAYWTTPTDFFLIWFISVPVILGSAHIDYILVAWLTEPDKTTSVSILVIGIIFYLFALSRFLYKFNSKLAAKLKRTYWNINDINKESNTKLCNCISLYSEGLKLFITFVLGLVGVCFASLQISAFYLLPFPSIRLVDYLDNIFQISLVIFGGLITYKVISNQDSNTTKSSKHLNREDKVGSKNTKTMNSEMVEIRGKLIVEITSKVTIDSNTKSPPEVLIEKSTLVVTIPQHQGYTQTQIPVSGVKMRNNWSNKNSQWHSSLDSSEIDFYPFSNKNKKCTVLLKYSTLIIKNDTSEQYNGLGADVEWFIIHNINEPVLYMIKKSPCHDSCEIIPLRKEYRILLQTPVHCYIVNKSFLGVDSGTICQFSHSISVLAYDTWNYSHTKEVRFLLSTKNCTQISFSKLNNNFLIGNDYEVPIPDDYTVTVKRHSASILLNLSLNIHNIRLSIRLDDGEQNLILQNQRRIDIKIPLEHLKNGTSIVTLKIGQRIGTVNPSISFGPNSKTICNSNIPFIFKSDDKIKLKILDDSFAITSNFQYLNVCNAQTASIVITNPIPTEFRLRHLSGWVNASWETSGKYSIIKYLEDQVPGLTLEVNSLAVNSHTFLCFPSID